MKRTLSILLVILIMATVLVSCSGGESNSGIESTGGTSQSDSNTTSESDKNGNGSTILNITFRDDGSGETGGSWQWIQNAVDTYENDNVTVNISPIQASEGDYFTKVALQLASDSAPDIVCEDTFQIANDVAAGYLTNLSSYLDDYEAWNDGSYYDSMKANVTIDGGVYGLPYNTDTRGLWYNKDIFEAAGLDREWAPSNWDEIFDALYAIQKYDSSIVPFWMNSGTATGEATSMQTYEMLLYAAGGRLMDDAGEKWVIKSKHILTALGFIEKIYSENLGPSMSLVLDGQAGNTSAREYLPEGKLAVSLDGSWITGNYIKGVGTVDWPDYAETLGFAAFPTSEGQDPGTMTLAGGWALSIPERSKNKDAAWDFIVHMMDAEILEQGVIAMGSITTRTDVAQMDNYSAIPFMDIATEFLETAEFRPKNELYSTVSTCIQEMVESVASQSSTPEEAMEKYATDVTRVVGADAVISLE